MNKTYKTLIISPHCDDEVLGCCGILNKAFVYYIGVDNFHIVSKEERVKEVKSVSMLLNFDYMIGDSIVNNYSKHGLINEITDLINELKPNEIYIPNKNYNQDHQAVYEACIISLRPHDLNHFVKKIFIYEVEQYLLWGENDFEPNYFIEIDINKKIQAYELYKSQVRDMRPPELLKQYSRIRGLSSNMKYAESFKIIRYIRSKNDTIISSI